MKIAILSDIHANKYALEAVEKDYEDTKAIWMLGDAFGRGPHPMEIYNWMNSLFFANSNDNRWVAGNHDSSILGWNGHNKNVTPYEIRKIDEKHAEILKKSEGYPGIFIGEQMLRADSFEKEGRRYTITHEIGNFGYIFPWNDYAVKQSLCKYKDTHFGSIIFCGHTHVPLLAGLDNQDRLENIKIIPYDEYPLDHNHLWLINPGSVGAPADLDVRAAYAILDTEKETIQFRKVSYNHKSVIEDMDNTYARIIRDQLNDARLQEALVAPEWSEHFLKIRNTVCSDG